MRNALAKTLYALAKEDPRIVVLVADISPAGAMDEFRREFPERFISTGVAEQSMIGLAAGLAMRGFRPFCYTIATFALFRAYEFIRCDLAYQDLPVVVVGMGAGLSYSSLGGTHQAIEDVAVAMACPSLTVLAPCDPQTTRECVEWCARREAGGPVYLRIGKAGEPDLTAHHGSESLDRPLLFNMGHYQGALVVSYGPIAGEALKLAGMIGAPAAVVINLTDSTRAAALAGAYEQVIVVEEASCAPLASLLRARLPGQEIWSFALPRVFPHAYGTREELLAAAGLTADKMMAILLR